jgi:hypothetical protein
VRAAQLVKPGGTLVYSTCSLNPVEDEAVVAELLRADPSLTVVEDPRAPQLVRRPGLTTWKVLDEGDDGLVEYASPGDVPEGKMRRFRASVFPPTDSRIKAQLTRCMRFLPHDADAGGFFVCVLRKEGSTVAETATTEAPPKKDKPDGRQLSEDVKYVRFRDAADTAKLAAFFGLENFPWELLVCRSGADNAMATQQSAKKVVLGTPACAALCERAKQLRLRVVHAGVITCVEINQCVGCTSRR